MSRGQGPGPGPMVLRPGAGPVVARLAGLIALAAVGAWMVQAGIGKGWFVAGVGGAMAVVQAAQLLPSGTYLALDRDGFRARCAFRDQAYRWREVERFAVSRGLAPDVAFNFAPGYRGALRTRRLADALGGFERTLLSHYGMDPEDLAALMNDFRARAAAEEERLGLVQEGDRGSPGGRRVAGGEA